MKPGKSCEEAVQRIIEVIRTSGIKFSVVRQKVFQYLNAAIAQRSNFYKSKYQRNGDDKLEQFHSVILDLVLYREFDVAAFMDYYGKNPQWAFDPAQSKQLRAGIGSFCAKNTKDAEQLLKSTMNGLKPTRS